MTLRIQNSTEHGRIVFRLIGRIQSDQIPALRALFSSDGRDYAALELDLREVKLVDRDVVRFLAECEAKGAGLTNCSAFIREWILQEQDGLRRREASTRKSSEIGG